MCPSGRRVARAPQDDVVGDGAWSAVPGYGADPTRFFSRFLFGAPASKLRHAALICAVVTVTRNPATAAARQGSFSFDMCTTCVYA